MSIASSERYIKNIPYLMKSYPMLILNIFKYRIKQTKSLSTGNTLCRVFPFSYVLPETGNSNAQSIRVSIPFSVVLQ